MPSPRSPCRFNSAALGATFGSTAPWPALYAATALRDGKVVTVGGRVLGVTASGQNLDAAVQRAYDAAEKIHFDGMQYRRDIGQKALARLHPSR